MLKINNPSGIIQNPKIGKKPNKPSITNMTPKMVRKNRLFGIYFLKRLGMVVCAIKPSKGLVYSNHKNIYAIALFESI